MRNLKINKEWLIAKFTKDAKKKAVNKFKYNFNDPLDVEICGDVALEIIAKQLVDYQLKIMGDK